MTHRFGRKEPHLGGVSHDVRTEALDTGRNKIVLLELRNVGDRAHGLAQHPCPWDGSF